MSVKTGVAPERNIAPPVAVKVKGVVMISSFLVKYSQVFVLMASALKAIRRASVPEATPIQWLVSR